MSQIKSLVEQFTTGSLSVDEAASQIVQVLHDNPVQREQTGPDKVGREIATGDFGWDIAPESMAEFQVLTFDGGANSTALRTAVVNQMLASSGAS
jgi:hypothetical protein